MSISENLKSVKKSLPTHVELIAVSKTKPNEAIQEAYENGQRHFGENKVQELVDKAEVLPKDIHWHMIGHMQRNKVKYIASFVHLIHGVDSQKLLKEINKQGQKVDRVVPCLLQFHIAEESTKYGFNYPEVLDLLDKYFFEDLPFVEIRGVMGMATNTDNQEQIKREFDELNAIFNKLKPHFSESFDIKSMGMSGDYKTAIECGANMIRIGSTIFGKRNYI